MSDTHNPLRARFAAAVGATATALSLAACGGGGSASAVPAAATAAPVKTTAPATPAVSAAPGAAATPNVVTLTGNEDTTEALGYGSPTFNYGNGVYFRNASGTQSSECANPIAIDQISLNILVTGKFQGGSFAPVDYAKTSWATKSYRRAASRAPQAKLPPPNAWVKFDAYSGYFQVQNGGALVSAARQCVIFYARHDGSPYDAGSAVNSNFVGGYNDPAPGPFGASGKVAAFELHGLDGARGAGSFTLDNGWRGVVVITNVGTIEAGAYANGIDMPE